MGPRHGSRSPCAPGRGGPLPRLPGRCLQESTIRRWGSGPGLHGDGFPGSREVRRRPRTINGSMQVPLRSRPNSTGLRLVLSPRAKSGGLGCAPVLARDEGPATQVCTHTSTRRQRERGVSGRLGRTGSHGHSGVPVDTARHTVHSHIGPRKNSGSTTGRRSNALPTPPHPSPSGLNSPLLLLSPL